MRFRPANIRLINRRQNLPRLLLALSLKDNKSEDNPIDGQTLTGHSISVLRRPLDMVHHNLIDWPLRRYQRQTQPLQPLGQTGQTRIFECLL